VDPDPDPGGPKTRGSGGSGFGSATLLSIGRFSVSLYGRDCAFFSKQELERILTTLKTKEEVH
jgi:hypothetical protein